MEGFSVRQLTVDDLDQLLRLEEACFTSPWSRESYRRELAENDLAHYWGVFAEDGTHAATTNLKSSILQQSFVSVGNIILQGVINGCLAGGGKFLTLEVRASNQAALHLYEKAGFVSSGVRPGYYDEPKEDAVIMWKTL